MKKPVIEFVDFTFQYRAQAKPTLNNINLTIYEGEKVLIVGPSGSGKSTLSNCINGIVPFSNEGEISGSLKVNGKETKKMSVFELSNSVGTVLQDPDGQFIGLTVAEDIAFKLENDCVSQEKMKEKVKIVSEIVGIDTHLDSAPYSLSGGQKQRGAAARSLITNPAVIFADEPTGALDSKSAYELLDSLEKVNRENNATIIMITHDPLTASYANEVYMINDGNIKCKLNKGNSRKEFYSKIIDMLASMGGEI